LTLTLLSLSTAAGDNDEAGDDIDRQGIDSEMEGLAAAAAAPLFDNCFVEITFFLVGVGDVRMVGVGDLRMMVHRASCLALDCYVLQYH
jgi:hypothetical protein